MSAVAGLGVSSGGDWVVVLLVTLLLFAARRLHDAARRGGGAIRDAIKEMKNETECEPSDHAPADAEPAEKRAQAFTSFVVIPTAPLP